jgi:hypothetical protein
MPPVARISSRALTETVESGRGRIASTTRPPPASVISRATVGWRTSEILLAAVNVPTWWAKVSGHAAARSSLRNHPTVSVWRPLAPSMPRRRRMVRDGRPPAHAGSTAPRHDSGMASRTEAGPGAARSQAAPEGARSSLPHPRFHARPVARRPTDPPSPYPIECVVWVSHTVARPQPVDVRLAV